MYIPHRYIIYAEVFVTGTAVLVIEVVATRILTPFFGTTIYTTSSVISVVLGALSIGYYIGGRFADRFPDARWFYAIIVAAGLTTLVVEFISHLLLRLGAVLLPLSYGPLVMSVILFFVPSLLLGMLSPFAVALEKYRYSSEQGVGSISGNVFFFSTFGSIVGGLLAGFVLIPYIGVHSIMVITGLVLVALGLRGLAANALVLTVIVVVSGILSLGAAGANAVTAESVVYQEDSPYSRLTIREDTENGRTVRYFRRGISASGAMYATSTDHVYSYSQAYRFAKLRDAPPKNILIIGAAATFTVPKAYLRAYPEATVHVVDIEPSLRTLGQQYFRVPETDRLQYHVTDGRAFLRRSTESYDVIFLDAFSSIYSPPAHLVTREFYHTVRDHLAEDGVVIMNAIGSLENTEPSLMFSAIRTFREAFSGSQFFAIEDASQGAIQNVIFATKPGEEAWWRTTQEVGDGTLREMLADRIVLDMSALARYPVLTDNYAPVEYLASVMLSRAEQE